MLRTVKTQQKTGDTAAAILLSVLLLALMTSCGGGGESGSVGAGSAAPSAVLVAIEITPANPVIALGTETQLKATGIYSDSSKKDLTASVVWSSSDDRVATVHNGQARSRARGTATVGAVAGGVAGSGTLTVTDATLVAIQVTPVSAEAPLGTTRQFTATGIFSDATKQDLTQQAAWTVSDPSVASISNSAGSRGLATAAGTGMATIEASLDGVTGSTGFTVTGAVLVSIEVTPATPGLPRGTTQQFTATGIYSDHSTQDLTKQVTWTSSDSSVAAVSNAAGTNGLATALAVGQTTIGATFGAVTSAATLTVTAAMLVSIEVDPADAFIPMDTSLEFSATGLYSDGTVQDLTEQATWTSTDPFVATVSNAAGSSGLATAAGPGSTAIFATLGSVWGSTTLTVSEARLVAITVSPDRAGISGGETVRFTATGHCSDGTTLDITRSAVWKSSDNKVAKVSNAKKERGLTTGGEAGRATITARVGKISGSAALTVSDGSGHCRAIL